MGVLSKYRLKAQDVWEGRGLQPLQIVEEPEEKPSTVKCSNCGTEYPHTEEFFRIRNQIPSNRCVNCPAGTRHSKFTRRQKG